MRLSKLAKAIISIQLTILLILPISAVTVPIDDYFIFLFVQEQLTDYIKTGNDYFGYSLYYDEDAYANGLDTGGTYYNDSCDLTTSFIVEPNTTYTITYILYTDITKWPSKITSFGNTSTKFTPGKQYLEWNSITIMPDTLLSVSSTAGTITYKATFNSGNMSGTKYFHIFLDTFQNINGATHIEIAQHAVEPTYDRDQDYFIEQILNTLTQIKNDNESYHTNALDILNNMFNYGSDYPLPSGGAELESAQNALSEAEGAISDKYQSIKDQISGKVQSNLELAASSADKVKQDSVQIKQLYPTVTSAPPDEVKLLFVVVPLVLFVGWLIGRVRQ